MRKDEVQRNAFFVLTQARFLVCTHNLLFNTINPIQLQIKFYNLGDTHTHIHTHKSFQFNTIKRYNNAYVVFYKTKRNLENSLEHLIGQEETENMNIYK